MTEKDYVHPDGGIGHFPAAWTEEQRQEYRDAMEPRHPVARSVLDIAPVEFKAALERRGANRKALLDWVRGSLVEGVDFGRIKIKGRDSKPSLWKPGAEKICGMLGVTAVFPTLPEYEKIALDNKPLEQVVIRCHLYSADGQVVADGIGARSLVQDGGDLNKALKMASKSAHIDATLRMAGLSEIFTQDLENMKPGDLAPTGNSVADAVLQNAGWTNADAKHATEYQQRLHAAFNGPEGEINETLIKEIVAELAPHQEMKIAVWAKLQKYQKDFIRAITEESNARTPGADG